MIHLQSHQRLFISEDLAGFADHLSNEGTMPRRVDLLLLGFSYAVNNRLSPTEEAKGRELTRVASLGGESQLAVEAVAQWYARSLDSSEFADESELLDFIIRVGVAGVRALKERWEGKSKSQIQWDVMRLASHLKGSSAANNT